MRLSSVLFAGFLVLTASLAWKTCQLGRRIAEDQKAASLRLNEAAEIQRGLLDRIHAFHETPLSFAGSEVPHGQDVSYDPVGSMVLYLFGPDCPYSPQNVPFLNQLSEEGVPVVGTAFDQPRAALDMFVRTYGTEFPILADPMGTTTKILPRGPVPLTAVILEGRLTSLWLGPLEEERREELRTRFGTKARGP
ncbi:MAG: hypothetical protein HKO65_10615 [Gemmatimonadetes bacterium]|nr:hypothetical protein [Gemmatimonadota bacterium]NNM05545.1 hypothetical protein [Gemmatimonadota bacterium]